MNTIKDRDANGLVYLGCSTQEQYIWEAHRAEQNFSISIVLLEPAKSQLTKNHLQ